jgi:hypothetical protein
MQYWLGASHYRTRSGSDCTQTSDRMELVRCSVGCVPVITEPGAVATARPPAPSSLACSRYRSWFCNAPANVYATCGISGLVTFMLASPAKAQRRTRQPQSPLPRVAALLRCARRLSSELSDTDKSTAKNAEKAQADFANLGNSWLRLLSPSRTYPVELSYLRGNLQARRILCFVHDAPLTKATM